MCIKKYLKITAPDERGASFIVDESRISDVFEEIQNMVDDGAVGNKVIAEVIEMDETKYKSLPEFDGF